MATLTDYIPEINDDEQLNIKVINISVYVEPQIDIETENHIHKKEISMEEKRRIFYEKRLEHITRCLSL